MRDAEVVQCIRTSPFRICSDDDHADHPCRLRYQSSGIRRALTPNIPYCEIPQPPGLTVELVRKDQLYCTYPKTFARPA